MRSLRIPGFASDRAKVRILLDGKEVTALEGEPVAVSLSAARVPILARSVKYHRPRGPFCFAGRCEGCLVRVDGVPNLASCRVPARDGMRIERQNAFPSAETDLLRTVDWFFPKGMDHHELFAWLPEPLHGAMRATARRVSGLGLLPETGAWPTPTIERLHPDVVIVGAGPGGLRAAKEAAAAGAETIVLEENDAAGGHLHGDPAPDAPALARELEEAARAAGATILLSTRAIAFYDGEEIVAATDAGLARIRARAIVLAMGTHPQPLLYPGNDLPGTLAARAAIALVRRWGVLPGRRPAVVGDEALAPGVAAALETAGATVVRAFGADVAIAHAIGRKRVSGIVVRSKGAESREECDAVVVATPGAPAFELAVQAGCEVDLRPEAGFVVRADAEGRTSRANVYCVGEMAGQTGEAIARAGAAAGKHAARAG